MFNYFLPGVAKETVAPGEKLDHAFLATLGLSSVLADVHRVPGDATVTYMQKGPSGCPGGTVIAPVRKHSGPPQVLVNDGLQTWTSTREGKVWIGRITKDPVSPRELERIELIAGEDVPDETGNLWRIPIARAPHWNLPYGTLPQSYTFDEQGETQAHLLPKFEWLWDLAGEIQAWYAANRRLPDDATDEEKQEHAKVVRLPFSKLVQYAGRILGVNYRVGFAELTALHQAGAPVLTNNTVHAICQACYGWQVVEEAKKKTPASDSGPAPSSSPSTTGDAIPPAAPGTDPAAEPSPPR